jgi:Domain of unknown function (DUF4405)
MFSKNLHRITGIIVSIFVVAHLFNHAMAWFGIETHQRIIDILRIVYRQPIIEFLLVACFLFQAISGFIFIKKLWRKNNKSTYERIQIYTGIIFGIFIIQHIAATLIQRKMFGFDTNFYFASRVVLDFPFKLYFIPYYFLGIMAFALHVANIHRNKIVSRVGEKQAKWHFYLILGAFLCISVLILYVFMGGRFEINIPNEYQLETIENKTPFVLNYPFLFPILLLNGLSNQASNPCCISSI